MGKKRFLGLIVFAALVFTTIGLQAQSVEGIADVQLHEAGVPGHGFPRPLQSLLGPGGKASCRYQLLTGCGPENKKPVGKDRIYRSHLQSQEPAAALIVSLSSS